MPIFNHDLHISVVNDKEQNKAYATLCGQLFNQWLTPTATLELSDLMSSISDRLNKKLEYNRLEPLIQLALDAKLPYMFFSFEIDYQVETDMLFLAEFCASSEEIKDLSSDYTRD